MITAQERDRKLEQILEQAKERKQELEQKTAIIRELVAGRTIKDIVWDAFAWNLLLDDGSELRVYDIGCDLYQGDVELAEILFEE